MNQNKSKNNKKRKEKKKSSNSIEKEESEEVTSLSTSTSASLSEQVNGQQNGTINRGVGRRIILKNTDKKSNEYSVEGWSRNLPQNSPLKKLEIVAPKRGEAEKLSSKKAEAVRKQRTEYYFSTNAGSAPSSEHFQKNIQHPVHRYPIEKNEQILIENKYDLMIKATLQKCDAWWIRVKSQDCDEKFSVSGLIANNSTDEEIRKACDECLISFDKEFANRKYEKNEHSVCSKTYLESKYITEIHEKSETFPEAIYYCNLCDYHMNNVCHAKTHLETSNHFDDVERWTQRTNLLNKIPSICENQSAALKKVLDEEFEKSKKARKIDSDKIKKVIDFLKLSIFENLGYSDVIIQQLGSTVYDVDLMDSDLNLTFSIPSIDTLFLFNLLNKIMKEMNEKYSILVDYANDGANMSTILFNYEDIPVRLCWFSASVVKPQHCFVELMKTYVMLRPEVAKFLRLVRVWATKANLDSKNKQKVGLPRYGFDIMAIHFLQQKEMIPILHQLNENDKNGDEIDNNDQSTSSELVEEIREKRIRVMSQYMKDIEKIKKKFDLEKEWNISELWVNFFKYYLEKHRDSVIQITQKEAMSKDVTKWNRKSIHVVDPFRGDNVLAIPKVSTWMPYFFNCILSTYLLFSIPRTRDGCVVSINLYQTNKTGCLKKKPRFGQETRQKEMRSSPRKNVQLNENKEEEEEADAAYNKAADEVAEEYDLNFYTEELMKTLFFDNIPLIKLKENDVEIDDHLNGIFSRRTFMRVRRKFKNSEHRFLIDSIKEKELIVRKKAKNTLVNEEEEEEDLIKNVVTSTHQEEKKEESLNTKLSKLSLKDEKTTKQVHEFGEFPSSKFGRSSEVVHIHENQICFEEFFINANFKQKDIEEYCSKLKIEDYFYEFDGKMFSGGCEQETKCIYCEGNHRVDQCSSMNTPPIEMLAKRTKDDIEDLDKVIDAYYTSNIISQHRLEILESAVKKLETYLKLKHDQNIILTIFGSVMTGIGQYKSDIDICLRFEGIDEPMKNINPIDVINEVSELLRRYQKAKRVQAITTAKVPIVKFQLILSDGTLVDADISYYNILAIYNTRLLQHYTLWTEDNRFAKLGLFIKYWAKQCDIGDASKGSISSYAYILLLISYLQQCDPPVLPILQEMCREKKRFVENWDTYFYEFESIDVVRRWQKNRQTCAELLMGFFDYYANYRFKHFVIQCRREAMLSKLEKDWNKPLCIEDPFDLSHNLGSGVTKKMFIFIHRNFICSRKVFMTSTPTKEMKTLKNFCDFYRLKLIKDCWQGKAPIDRLCHFCGRVGHFVENCPRKLAKSEARKVRTSSLYSNASIRQKSQAKNANEKQNHFTSGRQPNSQNF